MYYVKSYSNPYRLVIWEDVHGDNNRVRLCKALIGDELDFSNAVNKDIFFGITNGHPIMSCETLEEAAEMSCLEAL